MKTGRLRIDVVYDETKTDMDAIADAADTLLQTALSTDDILDEYANPTFEPFYVQYHDEKRGPEPKERYCTECLAPLNGYHLPDCSEARGQTDSVVEEDECRKTCPYCSGNCPNEPDDSDHLCDGFAGDIDGLSAAEEEQRKDEKRGLHPEHEDPSN